MLNPHIALFLNVNEDANAAKTLRRPIPMGELQKRSLPLYANALHHADSQGSCATPSGSLVLLLEVCKYLGLGQRRG